MKLLLKRHPPEGIVLTPEQENAFPSVDQLDVGELVINAVTGKLYTKLLDGSVVEFVSQKICFDPIPEILFFYENNPISPPSYLVNNFCCAGGLFTIVVDKLKPSPADYSFNLTELTNNTVKENISLSPPSYTTYSVTQNDESIIYRKATIPASISITDTNYNNISLFQFSVSDNITGRIVRGGERILTIKCLEGN
jgi:hypothetical protein